MPHCNNVCAVLQYSDSLAHAALWRYQLRMRLYGYFRSTASWRVRIGLAWKGLAVDQTAIDLKSGAQRDPAWLARNPQGYVPALELDDGTLLTQSLAILEWLDDAYPNPAFLPEDPVARAQVRAAALVIAADTHPIQNLGILKRVEALAGPDAAKSWARAIITQGLAAYEALVQAEPFRSGPFSFGTKPTLADMCLVPMLGNARRFGVDLVAFPRVMLIEAACAALPAFAAARPDVQPDAD